MCLAIAAIIELSLAASEVGNVLRNWSLVPMIDVSLENGACPSGYEEMRKSWDLMTDQYSWTQYEKVWAEYHGTKNGCNCWGRFGCEK